MARIISLYYNAWKPRLLPQAQAWYERLEQVRPAPPRLLGQALCPTAGCTRQLSPASDLTVWGGCPRSTLVTGLGVQAREEAAESPEKEDEDSDAGQPERDPASGKPRRNQAYNVRRMLRDTLCWARSTARGQVWDR